MVAYVGFVTSMHPRMGLERGRLSERFTTNFTAIRPKSIVFATMAEHGGLVAKAFMTHVALEGFLAGVLTKMIV